MGEALPEAGGRSTGVIAWFVRNRVAANLVFFGVCLAGYLAVGEVPHEIIPQTSASAIRVQVVLPGADALAVEERVLLSLEETLRGIGGVTEMTGVAADSAALVMLELEPGADIRAVGDTVRARLVSLATFPAEVEAPVVTEIQASREILRLAVHGHADEASLREAAWRVRNAVAGAPGVLSVERLTGRDRELVIEVPEENLTRFGLTFDGVAAAVRQATAEVPAGTVRSGPHEVVLRSEGAAFLADSFRGIPLVAAPDGGLIRLGDIGTVTDGFDRTERQAWMNGEPAVHLTVAQAEGARLKDTTDRVLEAVRDVTLPDGFAVTPWYLASESFSDRLELMLRNGLYGLGLIFLVLFFTLSTRLAVWTAAGLPFTFLGAFLLMPGLGVSVNLISMFGFIMALGVVVDDAIVVGESIQHRLDGGGEGVEEAAIRGARKVFFPAACGVLTTMAAFAPLLGIPGVYGEFVADLPRVVIPILGFSLLEAAWVLPHHLAHGGLPVRPSRRLARIRGFCQAGFDGTVRRIYRPALRWALGNRLATLALGVLFLSLALGLVGGRWIPLATGSPLENNIVNVLVRLPPGATVEATREVVARVERVVDDVRADILGESGPDVERHRAVLVGQQFPLGVGEALGGADASAGPALGQVLWRLIPAGGRGDFSTLNVADRVRSGIREESLDADISVTTDAFGGQADLSIRVRGPGLDGLRAASAALGARLLDTPGVTTVRDDMHDSAPGLVARPRGAGTGVGVTAAALGRQLRQAFHGEEIQRIQRDREVVRVLLRAPGTTPGDVVGLSAMPVRRPDGLVAQLGEVAEVSRESGESVIRRLDSARTITVLANVDRAQILPEEATAEVRSRILPELEERFPGVAFEIAGLAAEQAESQSVVARNALLATMVIYVLLAIPLASWIQPFVILAAIPFGLAGAVYGHLIMGMALDLMSIFGMAPLIGIVVNDALVMLDFINRRRAAGLPAREAVLEAGPARFRAIVLTTVTTCAGVAPMIAETSFQAALLVPVAVSLAFGLAFATPVTLLLVPVIYSLASRVGPARSD